MSLEPHVPWDLAHDSFLQVVMLAIDPVDTVSPVTVQLEILPLVPPTPTVKMRLFLLTLSLSPMVFAPETYLAPFRDCEPHLRIPNHYGVTLRENHTLAHHWLIIGHDLSNTPDYSGHVISDDGIIRHYYVTIDEKTIQTKVRLDHGVESVQSMSP